MLQRIKRPLSLILAFIVLISMIGTIAFADEGLSVDYGSLETEPGFNWWEDGNSVEGNLTPSEPEEITTPEESQPEAPDRESSSSEDESSSKSKDEDTEKENNDSAPKQATANVLDSGLPSEPYSLTIPIQIEGKRSRSADALSISWYPAYNYNFEIAPGYPIYGQWCSYKINNKLVYCLEPKNLVSTDGTLYQSTTSWPAMGFEQQQSISFILLYGASDDGNIPEHIATQALIWEVALNYRDSTFTRTSNYIYNGIISGSSAETYYNQIADKVAKHKKIPNFMGDSKATAPTYVLAEKDGKYSFEVTDTRNVLADMSFPAISGVTFTKSGNKLTITSDRAIDPAELVESVKSGTEGGSGNPLVFWVAQGGEQAKVGMDGNPDPVKGFFKISTSGVGPQPPTPGDEEYKITIIKRVEGTGELLPGATFEVRHTSHGVVGTFTTDSSGRFSCVVPWAGTYIITELSCPDGFVMPVDPDAELYVDKDYPEAERTFYNTPYTGIEVTKIDASTGEKLAGASIKLTEISTGMTYTKETGENGIAAFYGLRPADYAVQEIKSPYGYKLNDEVIPVSLEANKLATVTIKDEKLPGLYIKKVDQDGKTLEGATFEVRRGSGEVITRDVSEKNGLLYIPMLSTDTYIIEELSPPANHLLDENRIQSIKIDSADPNKVYTITFVNKAKPSIEILKVDADNPNRALFGATFRITDTASGHHWDITTDINGIARLEGLDENLTYEITEIVAPPNYVLGDYHETITLKAGERHVITIPNKKTPMFTLLKKDKNTGEPLLGATFRISKQGGTEYQDVTTDSQGRAEVSLAPGWWVVTEIRSPDNYLLDNTPHNILIEAGKDTTLELFNEKKPGLKIIKVDSIARERLPGATFRIFQKTDNGQTLIGEYTTDEQGEIVLDNITPGRYQIEEISSPDGFIADAPSKEVTIEYGKVTEVEFTNTPKAPLMIQKIDQDGKPLAGAKFKVSTMQGELIGTCTSGLNGYAIIPYIDKPQWVLVEEIQAPDGFRIDTEPKMVEVKAGKPAQVEFINVKLPGLQILKLDESTHEPVPGATFRIEQANGTLIGEYTSDASGLITLTELDTAIKTLVVREIRAAEGYILNQTPHNVTLKDGELVSITLYNKAKPGLQIVKLDEGGDHAPIMGAAFRVEQMDGTLIGEYKTDSYGRITLTGLNISDCKVVVTEIRAADGYILDSTPHMVTLKENELVRVVLYNKANPGMQILKLDESTHQPIPGATFRIEQADGALIGEYTTNAAGLISLSDLDIPNKTVVVTEIRAANGYVLDSTPHMVTLKNGELVRLTVYNRAKPGIRILKLDASTEKPVPGVTFRIEQADGALVGEYTTDQSGLITISDLAVTDKTLVIREIRAADGYILDSSPHIVTLKDGGLVQITLYNTSKPGLQIRKLDSVTKLPVGGVTFNVTRLENSAKHDLGSYTTTENGLIFLPDLTEGHYILTELSADGYIVDPAPHEIFVEGGKLNTIELFNTPYASLRIVKVSEDGLKPISHTVFKLYDEKRLEIGTYETSELGEILLPNIPAQTIYLQEIKAAPGFQLDSTVRKIDLVAGKTVTVTVKNKELGGLRILKIDAETKAPVYNACFTLYDNKGTILGEFRTDQTGVIQFGKQLAAGTYKLKETECNGYVVDDTIRTITIKDGETKEIIIENQPERGKVQIIKIASEKNPITGDKKGDPLKGARFEIYNEKREVVDKIETDRRGTATSKPLPLGRYALRETRSPDFYFTDGKPIYFELKKHDDLVRFVVENTPKDISVTVEKRGNVETLCGDTIRYDFSNIANTSNVELEEFYWHDALPTDAVRLEKLFTGTWTEKLKYDVIYRTNLKHSYRTWERNLSTTKNHELDVNSLKLAANEYITDFKLVFEDVPPDFQEDEAPFIFVKVLDDLDNEYRFVNKTDVGGRVEDEWAYDKDSWVTIVYKANLKPKYLPKTGF